ncbi:MAG: hypothetical protein E6F97_12665, partial [Actinobacteria bacterium]
MVARTSRSLSLPSATGSPSSTTSSGPRIRYSTSRFYRFPSRIGSSRRSTQGRRFIRLGLPGYLDRPESPHGSSARTVGTGDRRLPRRDLDRRPRLRDSQVAGRRRSAPAAARVRAVRPRGGQQRPSQRRAEGRPLRDRDGRATRQGGLADHGPEGTTPRGGETMNKLFATAVIAAAIALVALAAASGPARATYPGATNGRLAFGINVGGNTDVYTVRPDGQDLRRLTTDPGFDACAAYSADGRRIAYCSGQGGGPVQVWTMKQNGTDKQQVTHMSGPATFPDFSPDGSKIVFTAKPAGSP